MLVCADSAGVLVVLVCVLLAVLERAAGSTGVRAAGSECYWQCVAGCAGSECRLQCWMYMLLTILAVVIQAELAVRVISSACS